jgi:hypothetical protein
MKKKLQRTISLPLLVVILLVLTSCASTKVPTSHSVVVIPTLDTESRQNLGDTIITTISGSSTPAIESSLDINFVDEGGRLSRTKNYSIPQGKFKMTEIKKDKVVYSYEGKLIRNGEPQDHDVFLSHEGGSYNFTIMTTFGTPVAKPQEEDIKDVIWSKTFVFEFQELFFQQEFIYNGRDANTVKFIYREFQGDLIRPLFQQDVQYDLSLGEVIGFKNARFRIHEANNKELVYTLLSGF